MQRRYHIIYITMIALVFTLFILAFVFTPTAPKGTDSNVIEPVSIHQLSEYEREFTFDVSNLSDHDMDIAFFTKHQYIKVYGDNELIYEYTDNGGIWGHTNGVAWNFLDIPYGTSGLSIHLTAAYDNVVSDVPTFLIGDKLNIFQQIYQKSIPSLLISLLIVIFGIVLIIYWIFLARRFDIGNSLLYLGFFSTLIGLYLLNDTEAAIIGMHHRIACILVTYLTLMTLGPTGIIFIKEFFGTVENTIWKVLCILPVIQFVVCLALQFFNIYDLRETLFLTHIIICLSAGYMAVTLIVKVYRREYSSMLKASLVAVAVLVCSVAFNLLVYYSNIAVSDTSIISRLGFLIFILILSREAAKNTLDLMEKGRHAQLYQKLAMKDMLTGINNRNAYISDLDSLTAYSDIMIITFDLNNLKKCNDTLGHSEGDTYILSAARIINEVFSPYGSCYRIGGDEFCVMIKNASKCPIEMLTEQLTVKENEFNETNQVIHMHISYGYAIFDEALDSDLEKTRDRADVFMYENKRKSKEKGQSLND